MNLDDLQDRIVAAGEYVLGTLSPADQATFRARLAHDLELRSEVYRWQDRLLPLTGQSVAETPSDAVWQGIERRLVPSGDVPPTPDHAAHAASAASAAPTIPATPAANDALWRQLRRWRAAGVGAMLASVMLAAVLVLNLPPTPAERYVTVLQAPDAARTAWIVEATAGRTIRLVPIGPADNVPAGRVLQFWTKPKDAAAPTSLGVVQPGQAVELPADRSPGIGADQLFELTLEPAPQSPTGLPTGPILYVGRSVRL